MKGIVFLSGLISSLLTSVFILPALSQVTSDGTTNTTVRPSGNNFDILNGIQKGNNLFHSFTEFSIPTGSSATFNNSTNVENIINRVTGGNISNIDGLIKANGNANLFLINPAGIVFGENAALNIGGSFLGTTAESIFFEDGFEFSAVNPQNEPLLTVSVPLGLQIGNNPGTIEVQGSGNKLTLDETFSFIRDERPLGLQVPSGKTLALIGGDISLQGGNLTAEAGRIELGSVLESAKVELIPTSDGFTTGYEGVNQFGDISLSQATSVEVSGEGGGNVQLQGRKISLLEESVIIADTLGRENGGLFSIKASESLEIIGDSTTNIFTGFFSKVEVGATGNAGKITIETPQLTVNSSSVIDTSTSGIGNGGDLNINTDKLAIRNGSQIGTGTFAGGNSGDLTISATELVEVTGSNNFPFPTGLFSSAEPGSTGDAGDLNITTSQLSVVQGSLVFAGTLGEGNAGNIILKVDNLAIRDSSQISSGTFAGGDGGDLTVSATESIEITEPNTGFPTGLFSSAQPGSTGDAGDLNITTPQLSLVEGDIIINTFGSGDAGNLNITTSKLSLVQGSQILVNAIGSGNAGNVTLKVDNLTIRDGSQISTATYAGGSGGDLTLIAADSVEIAGFYNNDNGDIFPSGLFSIGETDSTGNAGNLKINSSQINIRDKARISAINLGSGNAGNLVINADKISVDNQALLEAETNVGEQGNINLNSKFIQLRRKSNITTNARGTANGGNITINSPVIAGFEDSDIIANAVEGNGGNINITTQGLFGLKFRDKLTDKSDITASSEFGINGTVQINNVGIEPSSGLVELPELINTDVVIANSCVARSRKQDSTFYITGKAGFPYVPGEAVPSDYSMFEVRALSDDSSVKTSASPRKKADSIVEATGIYPLENGELVIGRECEK
ncbi:MAG: S-layer family protein [Cyanobacteria bacterium P01_H01_bin.150]